MWLRWIVLVFIPSSWLMGVTAYLTTDLAPIPLMWIIPLALYLLSFILAFARSTRRDSSRPRPVVALSDRAARAGHERRVCSPSYGFPFICSRFLPVRWLAMVRWLRMRPPARNLSVFYVTIALGGLLGGIWNALVAPLVFDRVVEYPLALVLACLVAPGFDGPSRSTKLRRTWLWDLLFAGVVFGLTAVLATNQAGLGDSVTGRAGRDGRLGPGRSVMRDGPAQTDPVCARDRRSPGGRRSGAGRERPAAPHRARLFLASCA